MKLIDSPHFKYVLWALLILNVLWIVKIFPDHEKKLQLASGNITVLDARPGYSPDEAYDFVDELGIEGRIIVKGMYFYEDLVFPIIYGLLYALSILFFCRRTFPKLSTLGLLALFPIATMAVDFAENYHIVKILNTFPAQNNSVALTASKLTSFKWGMVMISLALTLLSFLAYLLRRFIFKTKKKGQRVE